MGDVNQVNENFYSVNPEINKFAGEADEAAEKLGAPEIRIDVNRNIETTASNVALNNILPFNDFDNRFVTERSPEELAEIEFNKQIIGYFRATSENLKNLRDSIAA